MYALPEPQRMVVRETANGTQGKDLAESMHVSRPRITQLKREIGIRLRDYMGDDILADAVRETPWRRDMRSAMENAASRHRAAA
jgi:hypothetical protein